MLDILIVVHDQPKLVKRCINSLSLHSTIDHTLYVWDNASNSITANYLQSLDCRYVRSEENIGFIKPNNRLCEMGANDYICLLNSDTQVSRGWDTSLVEYLRSNKDCAVVGYEGGILNHEMRGTKYATGREIDYVCGWCFCLRRELFNQVGLFDEYNLSFAYGEDSDFCLRMVEMGYYCYALPGKLVHHVGCATARVVRKVDSRLASAFEANHSYLRKRHNRL